MARFTKGKTFTSTEQVTSAKLHQLIDDAAIAIDTFNIIWPVGSIYTSVLSTNPNTLFGFGTWSAFGAGRTLVGLDAGQTEFDTVEETGGAKTHTLTESQIPSHTHIIDPPSTNTSSSGNHSHTTAQATGVAGSSTGMLVSTNTTATNVMPTNTTGDHTHSIDIPSFNSGSAGSGTAHNNLQPYIVVYFWKRTA